jgi:hypothetical protein
MIIAREGKLNSLSCRTRWIEVAMLAPFALEKAVGEGK